MSMTNKDYINKYPWLATGYKDEIYLDDMPKGWRKAFGDQLCEDIQAWLVHYDWADKFLVAQVKEKFGGLRFYFDTYSQWDSSDHMPDELREGLYELVHRYEELSYDTCCLCGKPATHMSDGWICPYCDDCY